MGIRISGKERVRKLFLDLAHFKNLWVILIERYKELYGLIADKNYSSKKEKKMKRFKEVKESILKDKRLILWQIFLKSEKQEKSI